MISVVLLGLLSWPYRDISVVYLLQSQHTLELYEVRQEGKSGEGTLRLVKCRVLDHPLSPLANKQLVGSPDGRRLAVVLSANGATIIQAYRSFDLGLIKSVKLKSAVAIQWSPTGDSIAYQTRNCSIGLVGISAGYKSVDPKPGFKMLWDRHGRYLFLNNKEAVGWPKANAQWSRTSLRTGAVSMTTTTGAVGASWLRGADRSVIEEADVEGGLMPTNLWSTSGTLIPFVGLLPFYKRANKKLPAKDFFFGPKGLSRIVRPFDAIDTLLTTQLVKPNGELVYFHDWMLFDRREARDGWWWLGTYDTKSGKRSQIQVAVSGRVSIFDRVLVTR